MINVKEYTKDTYKHVPEEYREYISTINQIIDANKGRASECVIEGWKMGYERAYRAAKAGKLDFQQRKK